MGAWPLERERLAAYIVKAMREAKVNTDWVEPNERHERAVLRFCAGLYASDAFRADLEDLLRTVAPRGEDAALGQTLLKLTSPGVPDIYQGDELWCLSLVDPDNRRPVDWDRRRVLMEELASGAAPRRETAKMHLIRAGARASRAPAGALRGRLPPPRRRAARLRLRARRRRPRRHAAPHRRGREPRAHPARAPGRLAERAHR